MIGGAVAVAVAVLAQAQIAPLGADVAGALRDRAVGIRGAVFVVGRRVGDAIRFDVVGDPSVRAGGDTPFEIGSITKTVTGALLADAIRRGEVRADEPIGDLFPAGVRAPSHDGKPITFADIGTQRSGLPVLPTNMTGTPLDPYADYDDAKLYAFLGGYALARDPGARYEYSNLGFGLLGELLAARAKIPYPVLAQQRLFAPLGLRATTAANDDAGLPEGHDADGELAPHWHFRALAGAGSVRSTARDMLSYAAASFDGAAPSDARNDILEAQRPRADVPAIEDGARIGFAWMTMRDGVVWHNGATAGFRSYLGVLPHDRRAVVIVTNTTIDVDDVGRHLLDAAIPIVKTDVPVPVDAAVLARYVGRYQLAPGALVDIGRDDRGLTAQVTGQARHRIYASSPTRFFWRVVPASIDFAVDPSGHVTGASLHQGGRDYPLTLVP